MSAGISRYNFKSIAPIPDSGKLIDIVLSKTNRKTPTEVRANFKITRIRKFYMRKVKFASSLANEKLEGIVDCFPVLDDIHPFYADLMNVLYDKDHYKLALGHVNKAKAIIDKIASDYVKLMKYADELYRCKMLKRAALGRIATLIKKLKPSLGYLEEVRKHLARLPSIDTSTRTLLLTGYPNVGKSSFLNNVTKADVDVQNYPFTTQSLFVGHTEYKNIEWQVIDTPGLLDRSISERNTIEMQAITALAHLNACILYFIDISETCAASIEKQISLFKNIRKLFHTIDPDTNVTTVSKPIVIVLSKIDQRPWDDLTKEEQKMILDVAKESNAAVVRMSNIEGTGIGEVKSTACDILLDYRLTQKAKNPKKAQSLLNRVYVANPKKLDGVARPPTIPDTVISGVERPEGQKTIKQMQVEGGGSGVWSFPYHEHHLLEDPDWKYDNIPTFYLGHNVADYYDPDIEAKLDELEKEEEYIKSMEESEIKEMTTDWEEKMLESWKEIKGKIKLKHGIHFMSKRKRVDKKATKAEEAEELLAEKIGDEDKAKMIIDREARKRKDLFQILGVKRKRVKTGDDDMEIDEEPEEQRQVPMDTDKGAVNLKKRIRDRKLKLTIARMSGNDPKEFSTKVHSEAGERIKRKIEKVLRHSEQVDQADRTVKTKMPKHLYAGKMGRGTKDRR